MSREPQEDHETQQGGKRLKRSGEGVEEMHKTDINTEWKFTEGTIGDPNFKNPPEPAEKKELTADQNIEALPEGILGDPSVRNLLSLLDKGRKINQAQELLKIIYYKDCKNIDLEMIDDIIANIWKQEKAKECILDALEKDIKDRSPLQKSDLELFKEKLNAQNLENFAHLGHAGHLLKGSKLPCSTQDFATRCKDLRKTINSQNDIPKVEYINLAKELQKIEGIDEMENKDIAEILVTFLKKEQYSLGTTKANKAIRYIIQGFEEFRTGCLKEIGQHTSTTLDYDLIADLDIEALELLVEKGFIIKNRYEALFHVFSKYYPDNNEKRINKVKFIIENGLEEDPKENYDIYADKTEPGTEPEEIEHLIPLLKLVLEHENIENRKIKNLFKSIFDDLLTNCVNHMRVDESFNDDDSASEMSEDGNQEIDIDENTKNYIDANLKLITELLFEHGIPLEDEKGEMLDTEMVGILGLRETQELLKNPPRSATQSQGAQALSRDSKAMFSTT